MSYATLSELRARLNITDTAWDTVLQDALDWAEQFIDDYTDRHFEAGSQTRYYTKDDLDPDDESILLMDEDLLTVTSLTNGDDDETAITSSQYWLWPRNVTPHWGIKLKSDYDWEFDTDYFVTVVGTWGYSSVASNLIKGDCLKLAEWQFRSKDLVTTQTPFGDTAKVSLGPSFPKEVLVDLDTVRRLRW